MHDIESTRAGRWRKARAVLPALLLASTTGGCGWTPPARPVPVPPPPLAASADSVAPPDIEFPHTRVWTARAEVTLLGDTSAVAIARPFTALEVLAADADGIVVRCETCPRAPTGRVRHVDVLHTAASPAAAAFGTLAEFALAIRDAAARADTAALRQVMAPEFTFSFIGQQGVHQALAAWASDGLATLSIVPELLDRGLAPIGGGIWAAPPEFAESLAYHGLRLGVRRTPSGVWEWVFLIRGEGLT